MIQHAQEQETRRLEQHRDKGQRTADRSLSDAAADFMAELKRSGVAARTVKGTQEDLWYFIEFCGADIPIRELRSDTPAKWLQWLRETPQRRRRPWSLPRQITPGTVSGFFAWPPKRAAAGQPRSEQTIGRFWSSLRPFFDYLGLPTKLHRDDRPNMALPPPLVPRRSDVREWWHEYLSLDRLAAPRIVLMQAACLLTGMRIGELLGARMEYVEGHWLLLPETKTHRPRILYVSSQALGCLKSLRERWSERFLFPEMQSPGSARLAGWENSESNWQNCTRHCRRPLAATTVPYKPHQALRQVCSTWLYRRDPVAESAQLGHGGGVVFAHYLDTLRRLPRLLEKFRLPDLACGCGREWTWPEPITADRQLPKRLYAEFRRIVGQSRRRRK
jgi:integrase